MMHDLLLVELFNVEYYRDLEMWVRGHSRLLKMVPFESLGTVSYSHFVACIAVAVFDCQLVTDVRARKLRSADTRTLAVNRTCSSFGDRTFAAAATRVRNSLPPDMRKLELSYGQFRRSLKTFLFGQ